MKQWLNSFFSTSCVTAAPLPWFWSVLLFKQNVFPPLGRFFSELKLARATCNTWCVTRGWRHALKKKNLCRCFYKCMTVTGVLAHVCFSQLRVIKEWTGGLSVGIATWGAQLFISTHMCWDQTGICQLDVEYPGVSTLVGFWNTWGRNISCPIVDGSTFQKIFILTRVLIALQDQN